MPRLNPLEYYLGLQYPYRVDADPEGGYVVTFPDLPGCVTQADSPEEVGCMAEEARSLWIETEYEAGADIPEPTSPPTYSGRFNLRIPKSLRERLAHSAEREGVSLNQYVLTLLARGQVAPDSDHRPAPSASPAGKAPGVRAGKSPSAPPRG